MTEISLVSPLRRLLLLLGLLFVFSAAGWFIARTATGDRLMAVAQNDNEYDPATKLASTDAAIRFAPQSPRLHYRRGQTYLAWATGEETEGRLQEALTAFRTAAQLSPEDYRVWVALGQALERQGNAGEAKQMFSKSLTLAPNYYEPHWALANHLLRNNETEAAFAEFKHALAIRPSELPLLFEYAWNAYNGDVPKIGQMLAPTAHAKAQFAMFLIQREKFPEGLASWREFEGEAPALARQQARNFINTLLSKQRFGAAYGFWQAAAKTQRSDFAQLNEETRQDETSWYQVSQPDTGSLLNNGDFESDLKTGPLAPFTIWRLWPTKGLTVSRNDQHHKSGNYSLQLNFDLGGNVVFPIIEQLVSVKSVTAYRLSFAAKTEELQTLSVPLIEVYDPANLQRLRAIAKSFPLGTSPWQDYTVEFVTTATTEAVVVRVLRPACGEPPCPILGKIWLDNFRLAPTN